MKRICLLLVVLTASLAASAQYVVSDKYMLWFEDTGHELTTRKSVSCDEDYQDLWNGDIVRIRNRRVYIYSGSYSILYGDDINLLYNGYYRVRRGSTWYLAEPDGDLVDGIYGKNILYFPWGYVTVQRSAGYWDVFHCSGRKLDFYSDEDPVIFYDGSWGVRHGKLWYVYDSNGRQIDGVWGESITLTPNGRWKCVNNGYVWYVD